MDTNTSVSLLQKAPIGYVMIDDRFRIVDINDTLLSYLNKNTSLDKTSLPALLGRKSWNEIKPFILRTLSGETISTAPTFTISTKAQTVVLSPSYSPLVLNKHRYVSIFICDMTSQKKTEEMLTKYKERLAHVQKAGKIGVFEWNIKAKTVWWSEEEESIFGVIPGAFKGTMNDWITAVHPKDREYVKNQINNSIKEKKDLDIEFRVIYPGHIIHWIRTKGHLYLKDSLPTQMIGIHYDVTDRKQREQLLTFKAEASRVLSSNLDYISTLTTVANLAVEYIADWCTVEMVERQSGDVNLLAVAHQSKAKAKWARQIRKQYPIDMTETEGLPLVLKTGKSLFVPFISEEEALKNAKTDEQKALVKKIGGINSVMIVPINLGKNTLGAITFVSSESKRRYTKDDLELAEQLASRASLAIENARLYETVSAEHKRLDDLLENVPGVVWESWGDPINHNQRITYVSSYAEKLLGYPREDWLNKPNFWLSIVHPEDRKHAAQMAHKNFMSSDRGISRFRWITKDGKEIWVESQSFILKDKKGKSVGMRGIVHDISESMQEVRRKDEFMSLASHELKTPITTIKAFTQLLQNIETGTLAREYLSKVEKQVDKLTRLVAELLDVSKIQEGKLELHKARFDLDNFLANTLMELQTVTKTHELIGNFHSSASVNADPDRLAQVITNLVTNAVKYSPQTTKVVLESVRDEKKVRIHIQDFGVGIAPKDQFNIFTRFYRVNNGVQAPGLGIGLFISREIIKRHRGTLTVKSEKDHGSTFTITLPLK